jgi:hypothetical protein
LLGEIALQQIAQSQIVIEDQDSVFLFFHRLILAFSVSNQNAHL